MFFWNVEEVTILLEHKVSLVVKVTDLLDKEELFVGDGVVGGHAVEVFVVEELGRMYMWPAVDTNVTDGMKSLVVGEG